jgi:predicted nuclease of predicted toxin-antitoxin system
MRLLLDECLDARLRRDLPGHDVSTVQREGWAGVTNDVTNGRLLAQISASGRFEIFVTVDKNMPHQQNLREILFAVVVLRARSNRYADTAPLMAELLARLTELTPGSVVTIVGR